MPPIVTVAAILTVLRVFLFNPTTDTLPTVPSALPVLTTL